MPVTVRRLREQRGQVSVEWVGILAILGAVFVILWATGMAGKVGGELGTAVCRIFGGECGASPIEESAQPKLPCVINDSDGKLKASVTVFSVKGGGEFRVLRQERSDGTVLVTMSGGGNLGAEFGLGGEGDVDAGGTHVGGGAQVKGGVNAQGEGGGTWQFANAKDADEFIDIVRNKARDGAIDAALPIVGPIGTSLFGEHRDVRDPDITYIQGGIGGGVKAEAADGVGYAGVKADGAVLLGTRVDHRSGERTDYLRVKASGEGSASAIIGVNLQGDADTQIAITYDKNGKPIKASVLGSLGGAGGTNIRYEPGDKPEDFLKKVKFTGSSTDGSRVEFQYDLDLKDAQVGQAFQNFLADPLSNTDDLAAAVKDHSTFQARTYDFSRDKYGASGDVALGLKFGLEGTYEGVNSHLTGAWYANGAADEMGEWTKCTSAAQ